MNVIHLDTVIHIEEDINLNIIKIKNLIHSILAYNAT